jgi:CheY-like chemotaxis protein
VKRLIEMHGGQVTASSGGTRAAGFDDHLVKPVEIKALQEALARPRAEGLQL